MTKTKIKKKPEAYINNKKFYIELLKYQAICKEAKDIYIQKHKNLIEFDSKGKIIPSDKIPPYVAPRIPEYIGECIFLISTKLSNAPNFFSYSFKDDMISDAYMDCILRLGSFDPTKSENPFSYFTQICWYAYLRRIKSEKKHVVIKEELIKNSGIMNSLISEKQHLDEGTYDSSYMTFLQQTVDVIQSESEKISEGRPLIKKTTKAHQKKLKLREEEKELEESRKQWEEDLHDTTSGLDEEEQPPEELKSFISRFYEEHDINND